VAQEAKPLRWRCGHLYPALVSTTKEGGRRARCLNCGALGPVRPSLAEATRALRGLR
jgi:hypothetical protein